MKVVITGANGSFGGAMVRYFSERGYEVTGCGRQALPPAGLSRIAAYKTVDITGDFELPDGDILIHAAAYSDDKANYKDLIEPNILGTQKVVQRSKDFDKFIHISSSSVYMPENTPINEPLAGKQNNHLLSPYGRSKLESEHKVEEFSRHRSAFILRARAFYGIGDTKIVPRILKFIKKERIIVPGKLLNELSMTHFENMGHAIECSIRSNLTGIHVYNVADERTYLMIDVLREVARMFFHRELPEKTINIGFLKLMATLRIGGVTPLLIRAATKDMVLDISKIKRELGYQPEMDFYKAVPELEKWINRSGGYDIFQDPPKTISWAV